MAALRGVGADYIVVIRHPHEWYAEALTARAERLTLFMAIAAMLSRSRDDLTAVLTETLEMPMLLLESLSEE